MQECPAVPPKTHILVSGTSITDLMAWQVTCYWPQHGDDGFDNDDDDRSHQFRILPSPKKLPWRRRRLLLRRRYWNVPRCCRRPWHQRRQCPRERPWDRIPTIRIHSRVLRPGGGGRFPAIESPSDYCANCWVFELLIESGIAFRLFSAQMLSASCRVETNFLSCPAMVLSSVFWGCLFEIFMLSCSIFSSLFAKWDMLNAH
mmetsp:Transcript_11656/g.24987  ORF Transcript_11656/g.24987 Transcript_11656/m.24987 type:complete len:202 (-) Transcript_11656:73-678(-)